MINTVTHTKWANYIHSFFIYSQFGRIRNQYFPSQEYNFVLLKNVKTIASKVKIFEHENSFTVYDTPEVIYFEYVLGSPHFKCWFHWSMKWNWLSNLNWAPFFTKMIFASSCYRHRHCLWQTGIVLCNIEGRAKKYCFMHLYMNTSICIVEHKIFMAVLLLVIVSWKHKYMLSSLLPIRFLSLVTTLALSDHQTLPRIGSCNLQQAL